MLRVETRGRVETRIKAKKPLIPQCVWKQVLENNLQGSGTTFRPSELSAEQRLCIHCDGQNMHCRRCLFFEN